MLNLPRALSLTEQSLWNIPCPPFGRCSIEPNAWHSLSWKSLHRVSTEFSSCLSCNVLLITWLTELKFILCSLQLVSPNSPCAVPALTWYDPFYVVPQWLRFSHHKLSVFLHLSVEECRNIIMQFGVREVTAAQVARVLGMMARTHSGLTDGIPLQVSNCPAAMGFRCILISRKWGVKMLAISNFRIAFIIERFYFCLFRCKCLWFPLEWKSLRRVQPVSLLVWTAYLHSAGSSMARGFWDCFVFL